MRGLNPMRGTAENQIKLISRKIMHTYYFDKQFDYLFSVMAPDIYYLGPVKNMQAEGKKKVQFLLTTANNHFRPCTISQDKYITKRVGWDHWLCEVTANLTMVSDGDPVPLEEGVHETFLFRRRKDAKIDQNKWELVYLHTSATLTSVSSETMLDIKNANKARRNTHLYSGLTDREKKLVRMIRSGIQIRDIAAEFGLAEITIKKALAKLYNRYNVKNRSRLCAYFDAEENNY